MGEANRPGLAAMLVLAAMALFGLIDNFIRLAAGTGGLWQFHFLRSVVALAVLLPLALVLKSRLRPLRGGRVLARSVANSLAMVIYFACLGFMPIAQVVAGLFTAPIFVVLFSVILFGETVGTRRIIAIILGFAGIMLALRPDTGALTVWTVLPVLAGLLYGLGNVLTRQWCGGEGTMTLLAGFFGLMLIWGGLGCVFLWLWPQPVGLGTAGWPTRGWVQPQGMFLNMILIQGVGSLIGVGLSIRGYQLADATFVAVFENTLLLFATLWAVVLWGEVPDGPAIAGLVLIAAAGVIIALRTDAPQPVRAATLPVEPDEAGPA